MILVSAADRERGGAAGAERTRTAESASYGAYLVKAATSPNSPRGRATPMRTARRRSGSVSWATIRSARLDQVRLCRVLYISACARDRLGAILARLGREPILTATDLQGLGPPGATIDFQTASMGHYQRSLV